MSKLISVVLAALLIFVAFGASSAPAAISTAQRTVHPLVVNETVGLPAVYLVPHQDDETISMAADIRSHIYNKRPVLLYLYTDGHETYVCGDKALNISDELCTMQRDREFDSATFLLGVSPENVVRVVDPATGQRPGDHVDRAATDRMLQWIISDVESRYPGTGSTAAYKAFSWSDDHPGHANMGLSLQAAYKAGTVDDVRFFLKRTGSCTWPSRPSETTKTVSTTLASGGDSWKRARAATFAYGIGNWSVPNQLECQRNEPKSIVTDATR